MTHLLQYFPQLSLRPENLPELRSLILQLAVEGKLTAEWRKENPDVEPASELLSRIAAEKAELVKAKKIRKEKPLTKVEESEYWTAIPETWRFVRLGEIGDWGSGATPKRSESKFYGGSINWFKSGELNNDIIDYESKEKITDIALQKTSVRLNQPGDVLIAMYGATIGKTGILAVPGTTNQAVCACTCFSGIYNRFLHLLLKALKPIFIGQGEGGAQPNISRIKIRNQPIPLPPLPEQKAIVQTVDALLQELDQLQQRTKARLQLKADYATAALRRLTTAPAVGPAWEALSPHFHTFFNETGNVQALRAAILQLAVQGKLTAHWRNAHPDVEPATELLSRIQAEKAELVKAKKIRKEKPLPPVGAEEVPFDLPEGWVWCYAQNCCLKITDGTHHSPPNIESGDYLYITAKNIKDDGILLDNISYVSEEVHQKIYSRCDPAFGDILFIKDGATTGVCCLNNLKEEFSMLSSVGLLKVNDDVLSKYLLYTLRSPYYYDATRTDMSGVAITRVTISKIKKSLIPLPPLPEQQAIVQAVEEMLGLCTALEGAAGRRERVLGEWVRAVVAGG